MLQGEVFRGIVEGYRLLALVLHRFEPSAEADDGKLAVAGQRSDKQFEGVLGVRDAGAAHAATPVDDEEEVEVCAIAQLRLRGSLVLHDLKEVLGLRRVECGDKTHRDGYFF